MQNIEEQDVKTILFFSEKLDEYISVFTSIKNDIKILYTKSDIIENSIKKIQKITRDNFLVIIHEDVFQSINNKIKDLVQSILDIRNPYFLILKKKIVHDDLTYTDNNFFYPLTSPEEYSNDITNLSFFIRIVFQRIQDLTRLDNYIINSFRTIIDSEILNIQKQEIEQLYKELERLSRVDYLTKVLNRKAFFEAMDAERKRTIRNAKIKNELLDNIYESEVFDKKALQNKLPKNYINYYGKFSCVMIDIDHFKEINDTHGHLVGDKVLKKIGKLLNSNKIFRDNDIIGRYGGEEFIVVLPGANSHTAKYPAERLRKEVKQIEFTGYKNRKFNIFISIGISEFNIDDNSNEDLINRADQALYHAKRNGRDQTVIYEDIFND